MKCFTYCYNLITKKEKPIENEFANPKQNERSFKNIPSRLRTSFFQSDLLEKKYTWKMKDKFKCLFCGGSNCRVEDFGNFENNFIFGLNSVEFHGLIVSQRPSTVLIEKYDLVEKFKKCLSNQIKRYVDCQLARSRRTSQLWTKW